MLYSARRGFYLLLPKQTKEAPAVVPKELIMLEVPLLAQAASYARHGPSPLLP